VSLFKTLIAAAKPTLYLLQGEPAIYSDGITETLIEVRKGRGVKRIEDDEARRRLIRTVDFKTRPEGLPGVPAAGHRIHLASNGTTYELVSLGGEPAARWTDSTETEYRLICQELESHS
jgi:hypothetical protein